jgi:hypothetical protein
MPRGKETEYTKEMGMRIADMIAENRTLREIAAMPDMPAMSTIMKWRVDIPEFEAIYTIARQMQAHLLFDETLDIADDGTNDWMARNDAAGGTSYQVNGECVARSRLRVDTRKFYISKVLPKIYGDKLDLNVGGQSDNPMVVEHKFDFDAVKQRVQDVLSGTRD